MASSSVKAKNVGKPTLQRDEKGKEELLESVRKRVECEKRAMKIVERLLEDSISKSFFEDCGKYITSRQFEDVAEERAIEKLCGYPLCNNKLINIPRQQFHISLKSKKVFDITERKNFCSQRCYQAHKYYHTQLSDEPLWTRDHKRMPPIKLLEKETNAATDAHLKPQNEIPLKQVIAAPNVDAISERTTEGAVREEKGVSGLSLDKSNRDKDGEGEEEKDKKRQEMLRRIAESVTRPAGGAQKEALAGSGSHVEGPISTDEPASSHGAGREQKVEKHTATPKEQHSSSPSQSKPVPTGSDGSVISESLVMPADSEKSHRDGMQEPNRIAPVQTRSEGSKTSTNSHIGEMQQPDRIEVVQAGSEDRKQSANLKSDIAPEESSRNDKSVDLMLQPGYHVMTVQTQKCHENLPEQTVSSKDTSKEKEKEKKKKKKKKKKKIPTTENPMLVILQYIQQCLMEWRTEETIRHIYGRSTCQSGDQGSTDEAGPDDQAHKTKALLEFEKRVGGRLDREELQEGAFSAPSKPLPDFNHLRREEEEKYALKVKEFFMGREMSASSQPATEVQEKHNQPTANPFDRTKGLPPIDSRAQVTIRRRILLDRLNKILPGIAVSLHLSVNEVNPMMTTLVRTFHPGSHNIVFKPVAWPLLTVVLIYILAEKETRLKESLESGHSVAFLTSMFNQLGLEVDVIHGIISNFKQGIPS